MKSLINKLNKETINLGSNFFKIAGKSFWQFFIPYVLSINFFGVYSLLQNISSVLIHTSNLGIRQIILRNYNEKAPLFHFNIHSLLLLALQLPLAAYLFNISIQLTLLIGLVIFTTNLYNNYSAALRSLLLFKKILFIELFGFLAFVISSILVLILKPSIAIILVIEVLIFSVIALLLIFEYKKNTSTLNVPSKSFSKYLHTIYNVGFVVLADAVIWKFVPLYFLLKIHDQQPNVAIFNLSLLLANAFVLVPQSILETWTPVLSNLLKTKNHENPIILKQKFKAYCRIFIITFCFALLITYIAFNSLYYKYFTWAYLIIIFIGFRIILSLSDFYVCVLYALKKEKLLFLPTIISSLVLIIFTYLSYNSIGINGVMISFIFSKFIFGILVYFNYQKVIR